MSMSYPFEIPIILELGNCTLTTRFERVLGNDALKWRLKWIGSKIKFLFSHFPNILRVSLKGEHYYCDRLSHKMFRNSMSCKPFVSFEQKTLINRLRNERYL